MFAIVCALMLAGASCPPSSPETAVYNGRLSQLAVRMPRIDAAPAIDGRLDEPVWRAAAVLTGFSEYYPADDRPAEDSTEVLVWYSPTAIYFGIRAWEPHGAVRATLADRDAIDRDDWVQLLLGTYNDRRQATVFSVNPLGVQSDGTVVETGKAQVGFGQSGTGRPEPDLSPDLVWQSRGHVTPWGYEVEIRIPFRSLRYQPLPVQSWGIAIVRRVQHSGHEDSWTPARRAAASFLAQAGTLDGLTDLHRGLVLDVNPELTARATGAPGDAGWTYERHAPSLGANVRWGVTNNLTLNGTVNPDFSQVESDAGQLVYDPRDALYFDEKRPFFLDGIEQFDTPNSLIYTRRIVQPVEATKLTGKIGGTDVAALSAVDGRAYSASGRDNPVYTILRVQRDLGRDSRVGMAYTDRIDGADWNRVADIDSRLVLGRIWSVQTQLAGSMTRSAAATTTAPLWQMVVQRRGHHVGLVSAITGIDPDFVAASGFVARAGIVHATVDPSYTLYGAPGSAVERVGGDVTLDGTWQYDRFVRRGDIQDKKLHFNTSATLRGGWQAGASLLLETFGYDDALYANYRVELPLAGGGRDTVPFTGTPRLPNRDWVASLGTPRFRHFSGSAFVIWGRDDNFYEWAPSDILLVQLGLDWNPTDRLRVNAAYQTQQYRRPSDGSVTARGTIPRLKVEYQLTRSIFLRVVGQYDAEMQDSLRDDSRTGAPLLLYDPSAGTYARPAFRTTNTFRADWLFSYQPSPGTVLFAGYGSTMREPRSLRFDGLRRSDDAFFLKLSYLYRM